MWVPKGFCESLVHTPHNCEEGHLIPLALKGISFSIVLTCPSRLSICLTYDNYFFTPLCLLLPVCQVPRVGNESSSLFLQCQVQCLISILQTFPVWNKNIKGQRVGSCGTGSCHQTWQSVLNTGTHVTEEDNEHVQTQPINVKTIRFLIWMNKWMRRFQGDHVHKAETIHYVITTLMTSSSNNFICCLPYF